MKEKSKNVPQQRKSNVWKWVTKSCISSEKFKTTSNILRYEKIHEKYLDISDPIFTMNRAREQNVIFRLFSVHHKIFLYANFQGGLTPSSGFLPIDIPFLTNMWWEYFSSNIWTVFYQSELELSYLEQNWGKTRPLLLKAFETSNFHW